MASEAPGSGSCQSSQGGFTWPKVAKTSRRLLIGPANYAGQAFAWAGAAGRYLPDTTAVSFGFEAANVFGFQATRFVPQATYRDDKVWQQAHFDWVVANFSHVLIEAFRPLFGGLFYFDPFKEAQLLSQCGLTVGFVAHGSDVRVPSRHAKAVAASPFASGNYPGQRNLERRTRRHVAQANAFDYPVMVSTPDLIDWVPKGRWLPVVIDPARWACQAPLFGQQPPTVLHVPSNTAIKGSDLVRAQLAELIELGQISYSELSGVQSDDLPAELAKTDLFLDQFRLASYGVAAVEAMAAGRVVVGNVCQAVRAAVNQQAGQTLPIWQADPKKIGQAVLALLANRKGAQELASEGVSYAQAVHDGRVSAQVLGWFLGMGDQTQVSDDAGGSGG